MIAGSIIRVSSVPRLYVNNVSNDVRSLIMSDIEKETKYLEFVFREQLEKTKIYEVISKASGNSLGAIKWYGPWRQYCFFPYELTIWNDACLKDIQDFLLRENNIQKEKRINVRRQNTIQAGASSAS